MLEAIMLEAIMLEAIMLEAVMDKHWWPCSIILQRLCRCLEPSNQIVVTQ